MHYLTPPERTCVSQRNPCVLWQDKMARTVFQNGPNIEGFRTYQSLGQKAEKDPRSLVPPLGHLLSQKNLVSATESIVNAMEEIRKSRAKSAGLQEQLAGERDRFAKAMREIDDARQLRADVLAQRKGLQSEIDRQADDILSLQEQLQQKEEEAQDGNRNFMLQDPR